MDQLLYIAERLEKPFIRPFGGLERGIWDEIQSDENLILQTLFLHYQKSFSSQDPLPSEFRAYWMDLSEREKREYLADATRSVLILGWPVK